MWSWTSARVEHAASQYTSIPGTWYQCSFLPGGRKNINIFVVDASGLGQTQVILEAGIVDAVI